MSRRAAGEPRSALTRARDLPRSLAAAGRRAAKRDRGLGWEDLASEFLAAILTWAGIGWLLDRWLGTEPWLLISGAVLGHSLGIYLLWLRTRDPQRDDRSGEGFGAGTRQTGDRPATAPGSRATDA